MRVDPSDLPGAPRWDDDAAQALEAVLREAARVLDEQWALFDRGWWESLTTWPGPARAAHNEKLQALREPVERLRGDLRAAPVMTATTRPGKCG